MKKIFNILIFCFICSFAFCADVFAAMNCPLTKEYVSVGVIGKCVCRRGYYENGGPLCTPCPDGKTTMHNNSQTEDACVCKRGSYADGADGCTQCPNGKTTADHGSTSADDCKNIFKVTDAGNTWFWPDAVNQGEIHNLKN